MPLTRDKAYLDLENVSDDDLIALLRAVEKEIEAFGEFTALTDLRHYCARELLRRPARPGIEFLHVSRGAPVI